MVKLRIKSLTQLGDIDGVGPSKLEKYGDQFLCQLKQAFASESVDKISHETQ